jgi:hypothetical protein
MVQRSACCRPGHQGAEQRRDRREGGEQSIVLGYATVPARLSRFHVRVDGCSRALMLDNACVANHDKRTLQQISTTCM